MTNSMKKAALGAVILCVGAVTLGGCVYEGPYDEDYGRNWHHSHYDHGHDRYHHDHGRGDYGHDRD